MKTLSAALTAAQQALTGRPIARASLADNDRLHPEPLFIHTYTGAGVRAANCGTFFLRTRQTGAGALQVQKITDPTVSSQWTTWSALASGVPQPAQHAVFWTGPYVVVVYQLNSDAKLYFRRSTDGVSFSAAAVAYTDPAPAHEAALAGLSGGAANSGLLLSYNGGLYYGAYNPAANTWGALESIGLTTAAGSVPSLAGFYDSARGRQVLLAATVQSVSWARYAVFAVARTAANTFSAPVPYLHANRSPFAYLSVSPAARAGYWWLSVGRARPGSGHSTYYLAASADGLHWDDAYPLGGALTGWLEPLGALAAGGDFYLASEAQVLRLSAPTYWSHLSVPRYTLTAGGAPEAGRLTVRVDNRDGAATLPALHSRLTLERGYHVDSSDEYVSAGTFYVTGFRYLSRDQLLELTACDAAGLLAAWVADQAYALRGERVDTLVTHFAALAGIHAVSFDASALWAVTVANFTLVGGSTGVTAFAALQARVPFDYAVQADGSLYCYLPAAGPAAVATFGPTAGQHPLWPGEFGAAVAPNFVSVAGAPPASIGSDAYSAAGVRAAGRRWTALALAPRLTVNADADALAAALLAHYGERARAGVFQCPPHLALEPGDVIALDDGAYAAAAGPWRVVAIEEQFNALANPRGAQPARPFVQRVTVRGTT